MRILSIAVVSLVLISGAEASSRRFSFPPSSELNAGPEYSKLLKQFPNVDHPWSSEMELPASFKAMGLGDDAKVVSTSFYLDGGSRAFLIADSGGRSFVFCTSKPITQAKFDKESDPYVERFYVHAKHWTDSGGVLVPSGSDSEKFLLRVTRGAVMTED